MHPLLLSASANTIRTFGAGIDGAANSSVAVDALSLAAHLTLYGTLVGLIRARVLRRLGCDIAQGYAIARPMPVADFLAWLRAPRPAFPRALLDR